MTYDTSPVEQDLDLGLDDGAGLDLFGDAQAALSVVLVGTSFSDSPINNFPGFIAQHSDLEVVNYAITGGNQYGAITSYLTSADFQEAPPTFLVWENPIYNNLAQFGDQPMRELIAAARGACPQPLAAALSDDRLTLTAALDPTFGADDTLFLDADGGTGLEVAFRFHSADGRVWQRTIRRGERLRRTSRFYMPLSGLWPEGAVEVEIVMSAQMGPATDLHICRTISQGEDT